MGLFQAKNKTIQVLQKGMEEKNRVITKLYEEIGELYCEQYIDADLDVSREVNDKCDRIIVLRGEIEEGQLAILSEMGLKRCSGCDKENPSDHTFCSACGLRFTDDGGSE